MIFFPRDPRHPPHGRIDEVIYYGAVATMADIHVYACDFDDGSLKFILPPGPGVGMPGTSYGNSAVLDGSGQVVLTAGADFPNPVSPSFGAWVLAGAVDASGVIQTQGNFVGVGATVTILSTLGAVDSGLMVGFIVAYL